MVAGPGVEPGTQGYGPREIPFLYPAFKKVGRGAAAARLNGPPLPIRAQS